MVTMAEIRDKLHECHKAEDFEEMDRCYIEMNNMVKDYLTERFGPAGQTCNSKEFHEKKLGKFIYETLHNIGMDLDDIQGITLSCDSGQRNVFALETGPESRIWVKAAGTNRPITIDEIIFTQEIENLGKIIGEDVPTVINTDMKNKIMALSDVTGHVMRPSYYEEFSPTELATNALFEIIIQDADRIRDNVLREGGIIKEIDFAAITGLDSLDQWLRSKASNGTLKGLFNTIKSVAEGRASEKDLEYAREFKKAMLEKIDEYRENEHLIELSAPHIYRLHKERVDKILGEVEELLSKIE